MQIPQLFVKVGVNRFVPIASPANTTQLYFWDDVRQQILPAEGELLLRIIEGCPYFVRKIPSSGSKT